MWQIKFKIVFPLLPLQKYSICFLLIFLFCCLFHFVKFSFFLANSFSNFYHSQTVMLQSWNSLFSVMVPVIMYVLLMDTCKLISFIYIRTLEKNKLLVLEEHSSGTLKMIIKILLKIGFITTRCKVHFL